MNQKKFFIIYAIIIFVALIVILFVLPEESFLKNKDKYEELKNSVEKIKYDDISIQKERLLKNNYEYEYNVIHNSIQYVCTGTKTNETESGRCSAPQSISYDETDKFNEDKLFSIKYVEPEYIFKKIEGVEPTVSMTNDGKSYTYKVKISEFDTDIIIYTGEKTISKITITNGLMTYVLKYNNIKY